MNRLRKEGPGQPMILCVRGKIACVAPLGNYEVAAIFKMNAHQVVVVSSRKE